MTAAEVRGTCEPRFAAVREAFMANFVERDERGAAMAVWHDGRLAVDLWGGTRNDAGASWQADTLVCMMSVVKAVTALLVHVLVDRGTIGLDQTVASLWPAFAAQGKDAVRVRDVLDHRAGLPAVADTLPADAVFDWPAMIDAIEREPLRWPAGTVPAYHPVTMGFIAGELIRRVTGLTSGAFLQQAVGPIDYFVGVPPQALARCADLCGDYAGTIFGASDRASLAYTSIAQVRPATFNTPAFRTAEIPSINGHGSARAVATLFGRLAACRAGHAASPISPRAIEQATAEQWHAVEQTSQQTRRMGLGFILGGTGLAPMPASPRAFGHGGAGGALAFADPDSGLGFAYGTRHLHGRLGASPRTVALVEAVMKCVRPAVS